MFPRLSTLITFVGCLAVLVRDEEEDRDRDVEEATVEVRVREGVSLMLRGTACASRWTVCVEARLGSKERLKREKDGKAPSVGG